MARGSTRSIDTSPLGPIKMPPRRHGAVQAILSYESGYLTKRLSRLQQLGSGGERGRQLGLSAIIVGGYADIDEPPVGPKGGDLQAVGERRKEIPLEREGRRKVPTVEDAAIKEIDAGVD